jgi:hypothetical protein
MVVIVIANKELNMLILIYVITCNIFAFKEKLISKNR